MYLKRKFHTYQVKWCYLMLCQLMHCHQQAPEYQLFATLSLPGSTMHILSVGFHETNIIFIWHHSINRSIYKKMSVDLVFHLVLLFAPISHFILHQMFYFLCLICLPVFRLLFRLFVFVVTRENVFSQLYIHRMKPGLSLYLSVLLCYDRCWTKNRPFW